jgi:hypothetical protein
MVLEECLLVILDAVWLDLNKTLLSRQTLSAFPLRPAASAS